MKQQAFVNSKSVAASVSYLMELGADIYKTTREMLEYDMKPPME